MRQILYMSFYATKCMGNRFEMTIFKMKMIHLQQQLDDEWSLLCVFVILKILVSAVRRTNKF